jgi:hypothetical protein
MTCEICKSIIFVNYGNKAHTICKTCRSDNNWRKNLPISNTENRNATPLKMANPNKNTKWWHWIIWFALFIGIWIIATLAGALGRAAAGH